MWRAKKLEELRERINRIAEELHQETPGISMRECQFLVMYNMISGKNFFSKESILNTNERTVQTRSTIMEAMCMMDEEWQTLLKNLEPNKNGGELTKQT